MDKTFNNLMDIMSRTKKMDEKVGAPRRNKKSSFETIIEEDDYDFDEPLEAQIDDNVREIRIPKASALRESSAISNFLNKSRTSPVKRVRNIEVIEEDEEIEETPKKPRTKSTTKSTRSSSKSGAKSNKRSGSKSTTKKSTKSTKKSTSKKVDKDEVKNSGIDKVSAIKNMASKISAEKESKKPSIDLNDPKNKIMYEALRSSLFDGGTDISQYMEDGNNDITKEVKISETNSNYVPVSEDEVEDLNKEQQAYEELFNGSLMSTAVEEQEKPENTEDDDYAKYWAQKINDKNSSENESEKDKELKAEYKLKETQEKISAYLKRKAEKIQEEEKEQNEYKAEEKISEYESRKNDYADIFSTGISFEREEVEAKNVSEQINADNVQIDNNVIESANRQDENKNQVIEETIKDEMPENETTEAIENQEESLKTERLDEKYETTDRTEENTDVTNEESDNISTENTEESKGEEEKQDKIVENGEVNAVKNEKTEEEKINDIINDAVTMYNENNDEIYADLLNESDYEKEITNEDNSSKEADSESEKSKYIEPEEKETEENSQVQNENEEETAEIEDEKEEDSNKPELVTEESRFEPVEEENSQDDDDWDTEEDGYSSYDDEELDRYSFEDGKQAYENLEDYIVSSNMPEDEELEPLENTEPEYEEVLEENALEENEKPGETLELISQENDETNANISGVLAEDETDEVKIASVQETNTLEDQINILDAIEEDEETLNATSEEDDILADSTEDGEKSKEKSINSEEDEDATISKSEFYNEISKLQANLISELKSIKEEITDEDDVKEENKEKVEEESNDTTEDKQETHEALGEKIQDDLDALISSITENKADESTKENNKTKVKKDKENLEELDKEENEEVAEAEQTENASEEIIESIGNESGLLNVEVALNEDDLEYSEKDEKQKSPEKDAYFYLSQEDNENKTAIKDEYLSLFNEQEYNEKEVGDININKSIQNAIPSSQIIIDTNEKMEKESTISDELQAIYTLMGVEKKKMKKKEEELKVLYVAGECQPFVATGGLADVAGSLPKAVAKIGGIDIRVILPLYKSIKQEYRDKFEYLGNFTVHLSWRQEYCGLFRYYSDGVTYYFIDNERYFKRDNSYGYYDDGERFAYFSKAIVECLPMINFFPDIIHCNDWQSALVSTYIKTGNWSDYRYYKIKHIYTIHNVEYQGVYGMENLKDLFGIDPRFTHDMEYNGDINLTKAAIQYSDKFTTVSNSYCDNLKQPYCSRGLHHSVIRNEYKLSGIVNGVDYDFYNPETYKNIYRNYSLATMKDKVKNKKIWQDELGLPVDGNTPMLSIVSRLVSHKGLDLLSKIIEDILQNDVQFVIVGTGDDKYVNYYRYLEQKYPTKVRALVNEYSNINARKAYAASDIFLMPSKIEPCGISQMIACKYGAIPVVRETGGLKDTIKDFGCEGGGNGYTFANYNPNDLKYVINRALEDYKDTEGWQEKIKTVMSCDFSWEQSAKKYIELYRSLFK